MSSEATGQPGLDEQQLLEVLKAIKNGDFTKLMPDGQSGTAGEIAATVNDIVHLLNSFSAETTRIMREVGTESKYGGQAEVPEASGTWKDLVVNINIMSANVTVQIRGLARLVKAVANGNLTMKIETDAQGEMQEVIATVNAMLDQLNVFVADLTRLAREMGTEGKLGGQMEVPGVAGTWQDVIVNVNTMSGNLTRQFRDIAAVITAMARGDLSKKIIGESRGEVAELNQTINGMMDQVLALAGEVVRICREIGTEGRFGGQAELKTINTWKDIVDSVNHAGANLTNQMRDFKNTLRAAAEGDSAKRVTVGCQGETLEVKEYINTLLDSAPGKAADTQRRFFLANVSHELRTPLNSMAILANLLAENKDGNLTPEQVKFASVIHASANDELALINELIKLSKEEGASQ
ncbi:MAG: HAMP domain-containing protein [Abitibacteriaceae bacterium]|nr:HAMP domain-containing protein [Abditibacteriaceae bacterium]